MPALLRFDGAVAHDPAIDLWLQRHDGALGALAATWFRRVRDQGPDVLELMHDGWATVCVGDAPFAHVGVFRAHVDLGFFQGASLPDPAGLLEGTGRSMRHVKLRPGRPVDTTALEALVAAAYRDILGRLRPGGDTAHA